MKKSLLLGLLVALSWPTLACDLCGCSNGSSFFGILPQGHRRFMGLRYRFTQFDSHVGSVNLRSRETFRTAELWGRFYPVKRVQVLAFLPYQFSEQILLKTGQRTPLQGLSDVTLLAHYNLLNTFMQDAANRKVDHNLLVGGGIKLPTGRYRYDETSIAEVDNPNFQLGTGSTDLLLNAIYTARYQRIGLNTDVSYRVNTTNANGYRFGNRTTATASLFYMSSLGTKSIMPHLGIYVEKANRDMRAGEVNIRTGGYATYLNAGTEVYLSKVSVGLSYRQPLVQNLSNGEVQARSQVTTHLTFLF